ncbi:MAG: VanZ family protein [Bacillota bacterium]
MKAKAKVKVNKSMKWLPTLVWGILFAGWLTLVFVFSSQSYEQQSIQPLLRKSHIYIDIVRRLPEVTIKYGKKVIHSHASPLAFLEFLFRKGAHLFVYATFASILFMFMRSLNPRRWFRAIAVTLVVAIAVPALDEWNQLQSDERTGNATDVVLDFTGACIGLIVCLCIIGFFKLWRRFK